MRNTSTHIEATPNKKEISMGQLSSACAVTTELHDAIRGLGTAQVVHSGRTLYEHLCGVQSVLRAWGQPRYVCDAGLFHSIYSTEQFTHATLTLRDRPRVQLLIGHEAERLVYLFSVLQRYAIFTFADSCSSLSAEVHAELPCHSNVNVVTPASGVEIVKLVLLHMANRLEQATKPVTGIGYWLSFMSECVKSLRKSGESLPKALADLGTVTLDDERRLHSLYLQGIRFLQQDDPRSALPHLASACRDYGYVGEPYLMLAIAQQLLGDLSSAKQNASMGRALLEGWGAPWHKRLALDEWYRLSGFVTREAEETDIRSLLGKMAGENDPSLMAVAANSRAESSYEDSLAKSSQVGAARFFAYLKAIRDNPAGRSRKWYPGLRRSRWHDASQFPVVCDLESRFAEIKAEALKVQSNFYYEEAEEIGRTGSWQVCMFYEQGRRNDLICQQCPTISSIVDSHREVRRSAGLIYLSMMAPHTYIAPHQGRSNIRLRCHLAISVPAGDCALSVGNEIRRWEEGRCLVFDDTYEHEVWNRTNENRLVLLIDLWHPDLSGLECDALETINWLGIWRANEMLGALNRNDAQRKREGKVVPVHTSDLFD
jgi:hypothetical protein